VSQDTDLDRWEIATAVICGAYKRCLDAYRDLIRNQAIARVSVAEFVFWACALDERLRTTDPAYAARRDRDEHGRSCPRCALHVTGTRTRWRSQRHWSSCLKGRPTQTQR